MAAVTVVIAGFLFSSAFFALFFLTRFFHAVTGRFGRLWTYGAPGFVAFLLFFEMPLRHLVVNGEKEYAAVGLFSAVFLVTMIFLYYLPVFSGINATFVSIAALVARLILRPVEQEVVFGFNFGFFNFYSHLLLLFLITYLLLQIRYWHLLSPHFEPLHVPGYLVIFAFVLFVVFIVFSILSHPSHNGKAANAFLNIDSFRLALERFPVNLILIAISCWFLTVLSLNMRYVSPRSTYKYAKSIFISILILIGVSTYHLEKSIEQRESVEKYIDSDTVSSNIFLVFAYWFDRDRDGNSSWPGNDPDDGNPCVRVDYTCTTTTEAKLNLREAHGRKRITILTLSGYSVKNDGNTVLLPSDDVVHSLHAMVENLNGMEEFSGIEKRSLFSLFAEAGYRTICGGNDAGKGYFSFSAPVRFDSGCQIFIGPELLEHYRKEAVDPAVGNFADVFQTIHAMRSVYARYHEERTLLWIHHESKIGGTMIDEASIRNLIRDKEVVIVVFLDPPFVKMVAYDRGKRITLRRDTLFDVAIRYGGLPHALAAVQPSPAVLYHPVAVSDRLVRFFGLNRKKRNFPIQTFQPDGERLLIHNSISGTITQYRKSANP